jgi:hypothetical protein
MYFINKEFFSKIDSLFLYSKEINQLHYQLQLKKNYSPENFLIEV